MQTAALSSLGIQVSVTPEFSAVDLMPAPAPDALDSVWHRASARKGPVVTVASTDGQAHKVRLSIQGASRGWRPEWTRWVLRKRKARELEGGDALDAQDEVGGDGRELTAMVLAGERREFMLELTAALDSTTQPGRYGFDVVVRYDDQEFRHPAFLTLRHPPSRLMDQLPAVYHEEMDRLRAEEDGTAPFFERFLLGFEDARRPLQRTLDRLDRLFGPFSAPSEFLLWLGAWVCLPLDENWTEMQRRQIIREAVELYRWRGTRRGLSRYLEIYTGVRPEINDMPVKGMRLGPQTLMGAPGTKLGDVPPHTFVVTIALPDPSVVKEQVIHDIIAFEKPAHTAYSLRIVKRT